MLSDPQVEQKLYQLESQLRTLTTQQTQQVALLNQLQTTLNTLNSAQSTGSGQGSNNTLAQTIAGIVTFLGNVIFGSLTASRPLKLSSAGIVTAAQINLAATTTDITGTLGVGNGGTNGTTATAARASLSAAVSGQTPTVSGSMLGSQSVVVPGSSFIAPLGGGACTGSFTVTIDGINFSFSGITSALTD